MPRLARDKGQVGNATAASTVAGAAPCPNAERVTGHSEAEQQGAGEVGKGELGKAEARAVAQSLMAGLRPEVAREFLLLAAEQSGVCEGDGGGEERSPCEPLWADEGPEVYRLGRGFKCWHMAFQGKWEVLNDERVVHLVEYLLKHPPAEAIHASVLENLVDGNPVVGGPGGVEGGPGVFEGNVGGVMVEGAGRKWAGRMTLPALKARLAELRATKADESLPQHERDDAERELTTLLRAHGRGGKLVGGTELAVDRVRKQIKGFIECLKVAEVTQDTPNLVLRGFGQHLEEYLWLRSMGGKKRLGASGRAGCFTYEPPPGVVWGH